MNRTYGKLGDGVIKNVECIGSSKVTGNFNDQSGGVGKTSRGLSCIIIPFKAIS